mgnify:CR=1 FL=1
MIQNTLFFNSSNQFLSHTLYTQSFGFGIISHNEIDNLIKICIKPVFVVTNLGRLGAGEQFVLVTDQPVQVTHNVEGIGRDNQRYYSAYANVGPRSTYADSYSFQTHG